MNIKTKIFPAGVFVVAVAVSVVLVLFHRPISRPNLQQKLAAIEDGIPTQAGKNNFIKQSANLTREVDPELIDLDSQVVTCSPTVDALFSPMPSVGGSCVAPTGGTIASVQGMFLGGQCCSALTDTREYHEHLEKLQVYKGMADIPLDPMHTPIDMARRWIAYDHAIALTPDEQKQYDEAYAMSEEKPCCCKCWHYFVNEGIAKKMIKTGQFNSKEIADYWDNSDICGS